MGKAIFVSYKYLDVHVQRLPSTLGITTARHYVDALEAKLEQGNHIYKGEDDGEDLSSLADTTIGSKLGDKIFSSSVTIVLISKGMRERNEPEKEQWIPWEVSYSLKEQSRAGGNSKTNAVLAVVLPDEFGRYDYFIKENTCSNCNSYRLLTNSIFQILRDNMFNIKKPVLSNCSHHQDGSQPLLGYPSYIHSVKWDQFIHNINHHINIATDIRKNIDQYNITKNVK